MKRRYFRYFLWLCLLASAVLAGWAWFRPYAWQPDSAARCRISETLITRDLTYFWVNVHLKVNPGMTHDLEKPIRLKTASGAMLESADTTFAGTDPSKTTEIWLKFWLEPATLAGPLTLQINDGSLSVKATHGIPDLKPADYRNYTSNHWDLWLGF